MTYNPPRPHMWSETWNYRLNEYRKRLGYICQLCGQVVKVDSDGNETLKAGDTHGCRTQKEEAS